MPTLVEKEASDFSRSGSSPSILSLFRHDNSVDSKPKPKSGSVREVRVLPGFELECIDQFQSKFTGTHKFKYHLKYGGIPIYGSSVIVELDDDGKVLFTDSASVDQDKTIKKKFPSSKPTIQESKLGELLEKYYFHQDNSCSFKNYDINPSLYYYCHCYSYKNGSIHDVQEWKLVYVTDIRLKQDIRDRLKSEWQKDRATGKIQPLPESVDYIINAHPKDVNSLEIIAKLSRIRTFC